MPTATATKKPAKKTARRAPAKKAATRKLSSAHKKALAEGRTMSSAVDAYLKAVNTPQRRGRKVSKSDLVARQATANAKAKGVTGVERVLALQEVRDLGARIDALDATTGADVKALEGRFIKVAVKFSEARGITYGAWRDAGVSAEVLRKAGIARTRDASGTVSD